MAETAQIKYEETFLYRIRHSCAHVMAQAVVEMFPAARSVRFRHLAVGVTAVAALGFLMVVKGGVRVPVVSRQLDELAHVKALGKNLEGVLLFLKGEVDEPTEIVFIAYREEGENEIYTDEYVARLPPVKYGYDDFLTLYGIEAQASYVELAGGDPPSLLPFSGKMTMPS